MDTKIHFDCDYMQTAHPAILEKILEFSTQEFPGYGKDKVCDEAKEKIRKACGCKDAEVEFLIGGTQTNATMIDAVLAKYEGVLATETAHIAGLESGAVEANGHKVITLPSHQGKINAVETDEFIKRFYQNDNWDHMVPPGMLYITHPTEFGTLYTLNELENLHNVCTKHHIPLYLDGARLGYGLEATGTDVTLKDVARLCDVFYIGGTKIGAMMGEAVVLTHPDMVKRAFTQIKRHGALLAKGWLLGLQFNTLFTDDLYFKISRHAIEMAEKLKAGLLAKGYPMYLDSPTNLLFLLLTKEETLKLSQKASFEIWEKRPDGKNVVRLVTSWSTKEENVDRFLNLL